MEMMPGEAVAVPPGTEPRVPKESAPAVGQTTVLAVLFAISLSHLLNDTIQALLMALYPSFQSSLGLSLAKVGRITLTFQCTASVFQPLVGLYADRRPLPFALPVGMSMTLVGLLVLSAAHTYPIIVLAAGLVGLGSAVFHPEASRVAYLAAGKRRGFAQAVFQVGGNAGTSFGPLLAALIVKYGQGHVAWFAIVAGIGIFVLSQVGRWQKRQLAMIAAARAAKIITTPVSPVSKNRVIWSLVVLIALVFSKYIYLASFQSFYSFYLIKKFGIGEKSTELYLYMFAFLAAVAAGTILGGPIGDKIGRKRVIWVSILGVAPFSLLLPHVGLVGTVVLSVVIGLILASAFSAILVYAQELMPGKVGLVAGLFFGLAFGIAGIGAGALGEIADHHGIIAVFNGCAYLPLLGILTVFLPNIEKGKAK